MPTMPDCRPGPRKDSYLVVVLRNGRSDFARPHLEILTHDGVFGRWAERTGRNGLNLEPARSTRFGSCLWVRSRPPATPKSGRIASAPSGRQSTLVDFFDRRAAKPRHLRPSRGRDMGVHSRGCRRSTETHAARDKDFSRTTQLLAAALKERDGRFARPVVAFGERASVADSLIRTSSARPRRGCEPDRPSRHGCSRPQSSPSRLKRRDESTNLLLATILCASRSRVERGRRYRPVSALEIESSRSTDRQRAQLAWLAERPKEVRPHWKSRPGFDQLASSRSESRSLTRSSRARVRAYRQRRRRS